MSAGRSRRSWAETVWRSLARGPALVYYRAQCGRTDARPVEFLAASFVSVAKSLSSNDACVVDDLAVDHRQDRSGLAHVRIAHAEVVPIEHDEVGELALLDRAEIVLAVQVPGVAARVGVAAPAGA